MQNIFIGYDSREKIASDVCEFSIKKRSSEKIKINLLKIEELRKQNIYQRNEDKLSSTEFTFSRFLIPYLMNYKTWALFCDFDFLWLDDITKLFNLKNENFAVMCCQHDYKPINDVKMDEKTIVVSKKIGLRWYCGIVDIRHIKNLI